MIKKNRDPRWDKEFTWQCEEPPLNDRLHVEVHSKGSSMNMVHPKVCLSFSPPGVTFCLVQMVLKPSLQVLSVYNIIRLKEF